MKKFTLAALTLVSLTACGSSTPLEPAQVTLEVSTNSKVQNVLNVAVTITGEQVREVTLLRGNPLAPEPFKEVKHVTQAPFSFTFDDTVPGNGRYAYRVIVLNGQYRTQVDREVQYTYTVGEE